MRERERESKKLNLQKTKNIVKNFLLCFFIHSTRLPISLSLSLFHSLCPLFLSLSSLSDAIQDTRNQN